ncbi:MAG: xanthine dehydrogenase family protein molybdopterin-binding subunit, partial [Acidobacteriaceae bacterium]|nr:xanthine dehydrogenase family protein molybdopterin-binding subunit [Acidobacteriaceae bacterium]
MSIFSKVTQAVVQFVPDRDRDQLSEEHRIVGKPIDRLDGPQKVTGAASFTADFPLEALVYASLAFSTVAKGKIRKIDASEAEKSSGVLSVITHKNAPKMKDPPLFSPSGGTDAAANTANVVNTDEIYWNGQPVAVVVADTLDRAEQAASLIKIEYDEEPAALSFDAAKSQVETPKNIMG